MSKNNLPEHTLLSQQTDIKQFYERKWGQKPLPVILTEIRKGSSEPTGKQWEGQGEGKEAEPLKAEAL